MRIILGGNSDIGKAIMGVKIKRQDCDVSKYSEVCNIIKEKKPSEIVNCAGIITPAPVKYSNIDTWENEIKINLIGSYYIAKAGIEVGAKIVFIGSTAGLKGKAGWSGYCASKAGLISLTQSLANEGYDVWCVNPSRTNTKMRNKLFPNEDKNTLLSPFEIMRVVEDCFDGKYKSGSIITVLKNEIKVQN